MNRWENYIEGGFKEIDCVDTDCIQLARKPTHPTAEFCGNNNEASGSIKGGRFLDPVSDYLLSKRDCYVELVHNTRKQTHKPQFF